MPDSVKGIKYRQYLEGTSHACGRAGEIAITLYDQLAFDEMHGMLRYKWNQVKTGASKDILVAPECYDYRVCAIHSLSCFLMVTRVSTDPSSETIFDSIATLDQNAGNGTGLIGEVYRNSKDKASLPTGSQKLTIGVS